MNTAMTRKLRSAAAYALWGLAAAGVLAAVLYVALARSGEAGNPGDILLPGGAEIITPAPPPTPTPTPDSFLSGGIISEPTATPDNPAKGGAAGITGGSVSGESINPNTANENRGHPTPLGVPLVNAKPERHWGRHNSFAVSLWWAEVDKAVRYDVERDLGNGYASLGWIDAVLVSEHLVTESRLKPNYRVRACSDEAGQNCGAWSSPAEAVLRPLTAPTVVTAAVTGNIQTFAIDLSWETDGAGAHHVSRGEQMDYRVERNIGAGWETLVNVAVDPAAEPAYTDTLTGREPVTAQYRVSLCAPDVCGAAAESESIELTPLLPLNTPTGFSGYYDGPLNSRVQRPEATNLSWNAPATRDREGRIEVQRRRAGDSWGHLANVNWAAGGDPPTGYVDEIVSSGNSIQVQYRIRACNPAGCSGWSNTVEVTVQRTGKVTF